MPGKRFAQGLILLGALSLTGCCSWCERNCAACHAQTPPTCYPPPVQTGCAPPPNTVSYPPAPVQTTQTYPNCTCTCTH